jgi:hypothetical protein
MHFGVNVLKCEAHLLHQNFQLLGINVFTYILATAIVFFLSMNLVFGPGWLGSAIGVKGTGSFSEVSTSLPDTVDLSKPDFLL